MALRGVKGRRLRDPGAPVPDDDVAGAVLLGGDDAFEVEVLDRMVLDVDGHPADGRVEGRALRDGPRHEDAIDLEPEVVVQPGGAVALDHEPPGRAGDDGRCRFRGLGEVTFAAVFLERHCESCHPLKASRAMATERPAPAGPSRPDRSRCDRDRSIPGDRCRDRDALRDGRGACGRALPPGSAGGETRGCEDQGGRRHGGRDHAPSSIPRRASRVSSPRPTTGSDRPISSSTTPARTSRSTRSPRSRSTSGERCSATTSSRCSCARRPRRR